MWRRDPRLRRFVVAASTESFTVAPRVTVLAVENASHGLFLARVISYNRVLATYLRRFNR
jgi:hypothetical protein